MLVSELMKYLSMLDPESVVYIETLDKDGFRSASTILDIRVHPGQVILEK